MSLELIHSIAAIFAGITGVAIIAVLVSKNSNTTAVIGAAGNAYSGGLAVALSPVTGGGGNQLGLGTQY